MKITYRVDPSCKLISQDMGITFDELISHIGSGMEWFRHFWNNTVTLQTRGRFVFKVSNPTTWETKHAWAWQSGNTTNINRYPISRSTGQTLSWRTQNKGGLNFLAAHEVGHTLITNKHITKPPYYEDGSFGHVMAITSYTFQGSFSPYEIWLRKYWGIKKDAQHPYLKEWLKYSPQLRLQNRDKLLKIAGPYYQLGYHILTGDVETDALLKALPKLKKPVIL